ncbi:MAG TPA: serine/threonine-protein kinase [Kofleriaceae bacterium]
MCPDEDQLVAMMEGALSPQDLATLEAHVSECDSCAEVLGGLGSFGDAGRERTVDRYQLDRKVAAGGMGEVWAAWDPKLRREVAIKLVRPDRSDSVRERNRLLREARALAQLKHPNVVAIHDIGEHDGEVFIVSELVGGDTLAKHEGDWRAMVGLYSQAARGLASAHAAGLVHRDVKPANLLVGIDGRVKVVDFGLAIPAARTEDPDAPHTEDDGTPSITQRGHIAGTPAYMSPEQRAGAPATRSADQYALCVALTEAVAHKRPPLAVKAGVIAKLFAEHAPDAKALVPILERGLSIDPAARYPDMTAFADALDELTPPTKIAEIRPSGEYLARKREVSGPQRAITVAPASTGPQRQISAPPISAGPSAATTQGTLPPGSRSRTPVIIVAVAVALALAVLAWWALSSHATAATSAAAPKVAPDCDITGKPAKKLMLDEGCKAAAPSVTPSLTAPPSSSPAPTSSSK